MLTNAKCHTTQIYTRITAGHHYIMQIREITVSYLEREGIKGYHNALHAHKNSKTLPIAEFPE